MKTMMRKKHTIIGGFTLLEMLVVMIVLSLLTTGYYGPQLLAETRRIKRIQADVISQEISMLGSAAQSYALAHAGVWPRQDYDCQQAHLELTNRLPEEAFNQDTVFYTGTVGSDNLPFSVDEDQTHLGRYYFDCSEIENGDRPRFNVRLILDGNAVAWVEYIANQLPNSRVVGNSDVRGLEVGWPATAAIPALDDFVSKTAPVFEGDINVNGHSIFDADEVILNSGQTLASSLQYAGIATPGNYIDKPDCPAGLVPQVVAVPLEVSHEDDQAITYFRAYAMDVGELWRIKSTVYGAESESLDAARVRVGVFTLCS